MPKKKRPEEKPEEQFKRFQEAARQKDVDEKSAEAAFSRVAKPTKKAAR